MSKKQKAIPNRNSPNNRVKRVALLLESDMAFDRGIARGIGDYIRNNTGWIILMDPMTEVSMEGLQHWQPDGIITSIHLPAIKEIAQLKNIPTVGFGSYSEELDSDLKFPIVTSDQHAIGRMAAQHFINNGIRNFAFCGGNENAPWCTQRRDGFTEELAKHEFSCNFYEPDFDETISMPEAVRSLGKWLDSLPKPSGVFVFFDGWARWVLDACVVKQINVPQEISVLGVDNDRWLCELSQPMLSSIDVNVRKAGHTTAELLDSIMKEPAAPAPLTHIAPSEVVARDSSSYMNFDDPEVAFALRYIKEHACDPISTADVLKVTGMSNSTAYRKFMKAIGRSIHNEIQRIQLDRIKDLLITTNLNVSAIAHRAGFDNVRYLTQVFRDLTGQTPTEYRRKQSTPKVS
jgi:LacI family transcriptional regulator